MSIDKSVDTYCEDSVAVPRPLKKGKSRVVNKKGLPTSINSDNGQQNDENRENDTDDTARCKSNDGKELVVNFHKKLKFTKRTIAKTKVMKASLRPTVTAMFLLCALTRLF